MNNSYSPNLGTFYTSEFIPFEKPVNKSKIAAKVINHHGDEVLKVFEVQEKI